MLQRFRSPDGCLNLALNQIPGPGLALEFGVASGRTLRAIAAAMPPGSRVVGFDSFAGLPEHWRDGFGVGMFRTDPPSVPGAELVVGLFADTLPDWAPADDDGPIRLVHIDCDLYSSTRDVLTHIGPLLEPGCLLVFDEFHSYPGSEDHEAKAWQEWVDSTGAAWSLLAEGPEQALIRLEKP